MASPPSNPTAINAAAATAEDDDEYTTTSLTLPHSKNNNNDLPTPDLSDSTPLALTTSPPFWRTHSRTLSTTSGSSHHLAVPGIALEDHSDSDDACWARHVSIDDYTVVSGPSGIGAYVVWSCTVETLKGAPFVIRKRFSQFDALRADLLKAFPHAGASIPPLPRKSVISRFRAKFLEQRKAGLSHFLNCVILNPEFSGSPILREFIFDT